MNMKRFLLIPAGALALLLAAGGTAAGIIAASHDAPRSQDQVATVSSRSVDAPPIEPVRTVAQEDPVIPDELANYVRPTLTYHNLGSELDQMVAENESSDRVARGQGAGSAPEPAIEPAPVAVTVYLSDNVSSVVEFLEENGGDPRNVGEDYIEAYVPVSLLGELSEQAGVLRVRELQEAQPR